MRYAVLGTGTVGQTIATKLVELGRETRMGSRTEGNEKARSWSESVGERGSEGTFAQAAAFGEVIFNCTAGAATLDALGAAGEEQLSGKLLIDVANPLDLSHGMPPSLTICNTDSLGEQVQRTFPEARVVKSLNTMNCAVMVDPDSVPGDHVVFVCGNDAGAKGETTRLLGEFGWPAERVVDLGDITACRGTEMYLPLWLRMMSARGDACFNIAIEHP